MTTPTPPTEDAPTRAPDVSAAGLVPYDFALFAEWSARQYDRLSETEQAALSFIWCLLHGGKGSPVPPFDLRDVSRFDDTNRKAIAAWVAEGMPFW